jgi:Kae1-associated kinase Bud32
MQRSYIKRVKYNVPKPIKQDLINKVRNEAVCMAHAKVILDSSDISVDVPELHSISIDGLSFSMEHVNGIPLVDLFETGRIERDELLEIRDKIKSSVLLLHQHGISHGDLYPRNVLIGDRIWLIDFEFARSNNNKWEMDRDLKVLGNW